MIIFLTQINDLNLYFNDLIKAKHVSLQFILILFVLATSK